MATIFLGGISGYDVVNGQATPEPGLPWVDDVSTLVRAQERGGSRLLMVLLPGLYGAYSNYLGNPFVPTYGKGVIDLAKLKGPTVVGDLYGGILSQVPLTSFDPVIAESQTGASNQVFQVTVTPTRRKA